MSSTVQDPADYVLLAVLGESIISAVVETCTFTLIYGAHFGRIFLEFLARITCYAGIFILLFSQTTVTYM